MHVRIVLSFLAIFFATTTSAAPIITSLSDLNESDERLADFYVQLGHRFNNRLDEVIFRNAPEITGPRLDLNDLRMIRTTLSFLVQEKPKTDSLLEMLPGLPAFTIGHEGIQEIAIDATWSSIPKKLHAIHEKFAKLSFLRGRAFADAFVDTFVSDLNHHLQKNGQETIRPDQFEMDRFFHRDAMINAFSKAFTRQPTKAMQELFVEALISCQLSQGLHRSLKISRNAVYSYRMLDRVLREALIEARRYHVAGKVISGLQTWQSSNGIAASSAFRKGITVYPLTRFEAVYKGIGPGECVRSCDLRFLDALLPESFQMAIAKDGRELGYLSVYQTVALETSQAGHAGQKIWFVETIQSPFFESMGNLLQLDLVTELLAHLQREGLKKGALVGISPTSFRSFNFKFIVGVLLQMSEFMPGQQVKVGLPYTPVDAFTKLAWPKDLREFNDQLAKGSGYKTDQLINNLIFSEGKVSLLGPFHNQPDWVLDHVARLLRGERSNEPGIPSELRLSLPERAKIIAETSTGYKKKKALLRLARWAQEQGQRDAAEEILPRVFEHLPNEARSAFSSAYAYVEHRINNVVIPSSEAQGLKEETLLLAQSWDDYLRVTELGDIEESFFAPFLVSTLPEFSDKAPANFNWNRFLAVNLRHSNNSDIDALLARQVVRHLTTFDQFMEFMFVVFGESTHGKSHVGGHNNRGMLIAENWRRFIAANPSFAKSLKFLKQYSSLNGDAADVAEIMVQNLRYAHTLEELYQIVSITQLKNPRIIKWASVETIGRLTELIQEMPPDQKPDMRVLQTLLLYCKGASEEKWDPLMRALAPRINNKNDLSHMFDLAIAKIVPWPALLELYSAEGLEFEASERMRVSLIKLFESMAKQKFKGKPLDVVSKEASGNESGEALARSSKRDSIEVLFSDSSSKVLTLQDAVLLLRLIQVVRRMDLVTQNYILNVLANQIYVHLTPAFLVHRIVMGDLADWNEFLKSKGKGISQARLFGSFRAPWREVLKDRPTSPRTPAPVVPRGPRGQACSLVFESR